MKTLLTSLAILAATLSANAALAADQTELEFDKDSVIIHCAAPSKESSVPTDIFLNAFPEWITNLQNHANEGTVARAH